MEQVCQDTRGAAGKVLNPSPLKYIFKLPITLITVLKPLPNRLFTPPTPPPTDIPRYHEFFDAEQLHNCPSLMSGDSTPSYMLHRLVYLVNLGVSYLCFGPIKQTQL